MISLTITEVKKFMSHLLIHKTFDQFYLSEADISTANHYTISGEVNSAFYSKEEFEELKNQKYSRWSYNKPFCLSLIKGNKTPTSMKLVFVLNDEETQTLLKDSQIYLSKNDINGLFLNIRYAEGKVTMTTGTSLSVFTMDKTLDHAFDTYIKKFLASSCINFEEDF